MPAVQTSIGCGPIGVIVETGVPHCFAPNIVRDAASNPALAKAVRRKARRSIFNLQVFSGGHNGYVR